MGMHFWQQWVCKLSGPEIHLLIHWPYAPHMSHSHLDCGSLYRRQGLYLKLCISRILPGGVIFSMDVKIYLYQNICTHSVTESKTRHLVIVYVLLQRHTDCYMTIARPDNAPCSKTGEFSLDLSEMRPVHVITSIMCHLKRLLRYGGYLSDRIQQNNFEMCKVC